jgi:hypothetical protein
VRNTVAVVAAVATLTLGAAPGWAADWSIVPSLLLPGYGQAKNGHYTKAAIFASVGVAGWVGVFATQINYNRAVEAYDMNKATYAEFEKSLSSGVPVRLSDIESTYNQMSSDYDTADRRYTTRNVFVGVVAITYALNALDILLAEPDTGELEEPAVSLDVNRDRVMVFKTIRF